MTHIKSTEVMHPSYLVGARCFHQRRGDSRVRVAKLYFVSSRRDGSGALEFLLTRYETPEHAAVSSILQVIHEGTDLTFSEVCQRARKQEDKMIMEWHMELGSIDYGRSAKGDANG